MKICNQEMQYIKMKNITHSLGSKTQNPAKVPCSAVLQIGDLSQWVFNISVYQSVMTVFLYLFD
jgi:hypothetical protein